MYTNVHPSSLMVKTVLPENTLYHDRTNLQRRLRDQFQDEHCESMKLPLRTKQRSERLDFALELGTAHFHVVSLSPDLLQLGLKTSHLVDTLLSVTACCKRVGLSLLDPGGPGSRGIGFG
jgi:hypothetical protein